MIDMHSKTKRTVGIIAGTVFMATAYYLPPDSFLGFFAAGLFLIPTAFFIYMIQKMAKGDDNTYIR